VSSSSPSLLVPLVLVLAEDGGLGVTTSEQNFSSAYCFLFLSFSLRLALSFSVSSFPRSTLFCPSLILCAFLLSFCWCSLWRRRRWWRWRRDVLVELTLFPMCFLAFDCTVPFGFLCSFSVLKRKSEKNHFEEQNLTIIWLVEKGFLIWFENWQCRASQYD
jgi:hypothetical protein